jgi:NADH-quinone oxidoreductase subunit M
MFRADTWVGFAMTTGIILGAAYMLWLYARVAFGKPVHADAAAMPDLDGREALIMVALAAVTLWMGIYPKAFLDPLRAPVESLMARVQRAHPPQTPFAWARHAVPLAASKGTAPAAAGGHGDAA